MKVFLVAVFLLISTSSFAGRCPNCTIKLVGCSYKEKGVQSCNVVMNETITDKPSCANADNRMLIDVSQEGGKAMLSIALAAQVSGKKVQLYGASVCDIWPSYESVNLIYIGEQ